MNTNQLIGYAAAIWFIIVGGIEITMNGVFCIACGPTVNVIAGIVSIVLGIAVGVMAFRATAGAART